MCGWFKEAGGVSLVSSLYSSLFLLLKRICDFWGFEFCHKLTAELLIDAMSLWACTGKIEVCGVIENFTLVLETPLENQTCAKLTCEILFAYSIVLIKLPE